MATMTSVSPECLGAGQIIEHVARAVEASERLDAPFHHIKLSGIFPDSVFQRMLEAMPVADDYRIMSGRTKSTRTQNGGTRTKIDLFPEYIRWLPQEKQLVWDAVGQTLCASEVREAFRRALAPGLRRRFGTRYEKIGFYPIPILTRDVPGYRIGVHPDTHWKGMTIQLYLPPDESISNTGTVFHRRGTNGKSFERVSQMEFLPNTGYGFAVGEDTFHSVDLVGPEVTSRDSILLTFFVDQTPLQVVRNRGRRLGNWIRNEYSKRVHAG